MAPKQPALALSVSEWLCGYWREYELVSSICANVGIFFATIDYETRYVEGREAGSCVVEEGSEEWRWYTLVSTCVSVVFLLLRDFAYKLHVSNQHFLYIEWVPPSTLLQIAFLMVFPYPYMTNTLHYTQRHRVLGQTLYKDSLTCYFWAEVAYVLMYLRLLFLLRSFCRFSQYEDDFAYFNSTEIGFTPGWKFTLQCIIHEHGFELFLGLFVLQIGLFTVFIRVFERPFGGLSGMGLENFVNSLWLMSVTTTIIGYGDYMPFTYMGRIIAFSVALVGQILVFVFINAVLKRIQLTAQEMACYCELHTKRRAASLIGLAFRFRHQRKKHSRGLTVVYLGLMKSYITHHRSQEVQNLGLHEEYRSSIKQRLDHLSSYVKKLNEKADALLREN